MEREAPEQRTNRGMRRFSKDEQAAIRKVAEGGAVENGLRLLGKLAPTGIVSTGIGGSIGFAIGGPAGAVAVPAAGAAARKGAGIMTGRNAKRASEEVRRGGKAPRAGAGAGTRETLNSAGVSLNNLPPKREESYAERIARLSAE